MEPYTPMWLDRLSVKLVGHPNLFITVSVFVMPIFITIVAFVAFVTYVCTR